MRYFDLPIGAVLIENGDHDVVDLVVRKSSRIVDNLVGLSIIRITFLNLCTGRPYTTRFYEDEEVPDDEVLLPAAEGK